MSGLAREGSFWSRIAAISQRCRDWLADGSAAELRCCEEEAVERMARDAGVSSGELRQLARFRPGSADLLFRRMAALDLDRNEVLRTEPQALHDLQRVCTLCGHHRRCARDLARDMADSGWKDYCPNAGTLSALERSPQA